MKAIAMSLMALLGLLTPPPAVWAWPVNDERVVVRDFRAPETPWGAGHRGLDLEARPGSRVVAPAAGTIHFSGSVVQRGVVTIKTEQGWLISMEPVEPLLNGSRIRRGETIGTVQAGHCPGGCLHIGLRIEGEYRSPARELGILRRATLQPLG